MKVVKAEPRDIWVTIDFSLKELRQLVTALDGKFCKIEFNSDIIDSKEELAINYLTKEFFPAIRQVVEDLDRE